MTGYTSKSPLRADDIVPGEQEIVRSIGDAGHIGRIPAFAGLAKATGGLYVEDQKGMTVDEALAKAGLDFTVEAVDAPSVDVLTDDGVTRVSHPKYRMNVARHADGSVNPVGMTKGRYEIVQNADAFALGQTMIGEFGANVAAAGKYGDPLGSKTYLALMLDPFDVHGDKFQMFVTVLNSHDGSAGLRALLAPLRLGCTNQTTAYFGRKVPNSITLRHTKSIDGRIEEAREVLGLAERWETNFKRAADVLLDTPMTPKQFSGFVERVLWAKPAKDASARTHTMHDNRMTELGALFSNAATNEFGRGTRYAAYNAVTEYVDWVAPVRGADSPEIARYTRTLDGARDDVKAKAFARLLPETARV